MTTGKIDITTGKPASTTVSVPVPTGPDGRTCLPLRGLKSPNAVGFLDPGYHAGYAVNGVVPPEYRNIVGYWHTGVDLNGPGSCNSDFGDGVYAARDGEIVFAGDPGGMWGLVIWQKVTVEGRTYWLQYAHVQKQLKPIPGGLTKFVTVGQQVKAGQLLTAVGRGNPANPWPCAHLHFSVAYVKPPSWGWWPTKNGPQSQVTAIFTDPATWLSRLGAVAP